MTSRNANTMMLWKGLKNETHISCLDNLPVHLGSRDVARLLSCSLPLVFISMCFLAFSRSRKEHDMRTRAALSALLTIVTPTCSLWPSRYVKLASILRSHICIPFEMIMEDAANGVIELRNPVNDLADLIGSGAAINGHTMCMVVGWKWWIDYFEWQVLAKVRTTCDLRDMGSHKLLSWNSPGQVRICGSSFRLHIHTSHSRLSVTTVA